MMGGNLGGGLLYGGRNKARIPIHEERKWGRHKLVGVGPPFI